MKHTNLFLMSIVGVSMWTGCGPSGETLFAQAKEASKEKNEDLAVELMLKAAEKRWPKAMVAAGFIYIRGVGVEPDKERGFSLIRNAAEANYPDAMFALGECYENGIATPKDPDKAYYWKTRALKNDSPRALFRYADDLVDKYEALYFERRQTAGKDKRIVYSANEQHEMVKAIEILKRLCTEEQFADEVDIALVNWILGDIYGRGLATQQDTKQAFEYYERAMEIGDIFFTFKLGLVYCQGEIGKKDCDKGVALLKKCLKDRTIEVRALENIGLAYADASWAASNFKTASTYLDRAIRLHEEEWGTERDGFIEDSLCWLGRILVFEDVQSRNIAKGIRCLERAVAAHSHEANYYLALAYYEGIGVEKDLYEADRLIGGAWSSRDKTLEEKIKELKEKIKKGLYPTLYKSR